MARVSKIKLDEGLEREILNQFWTSLSYINNSSKSYDLFSDLLSETERLMLAKRFAIAILILRGKSATKIHDAIHVSYSNICSVSAWVKNSKPGTQAFLKKISNAKNWDAVLDKIDGVLNKLPPRRHSDWAEEYKKRKNRLREQLARKRLT